MVDVFLQTIFTGSFFNQRVLTLYIYEVINARFFNGKMTKIIVPEFSRSFQKIPIHVRKGS